MRRAVRLLPFLALLALAAWCAAEDVHVRPTMAYSATITDPALIKQLLQQQSITQDGSTDSVEIIDAMANGFGENDLLVLYPSKQVFSLMTVEEPLKTMMENWHYNLQQRTTPFTRSADLSQQARTEHSPFAGLLSFIVRGLEAYYNGTVIEGTFRRDENTAYIALWNFAPDSFKYRDLSGTGMADTLHYYDLLQIVKQDTAFVTDSTMYDVIYVYKTYRDTVFIPMDSAGAAKNAQ
ncbi:MAG TPA: hypothetical protein VGL38_13925 [bacterium]|jgi:hypothetical protein